MIRHPTAQSYRLVVASLLLGGATLHAHPVIPSNEPADQTGFVEATVEFTRTDPTQCASRLELELESRPADLSDGDRAPVPEGQHALYFRSVPHRHYGVQRALTLDGPWELEATKVAAENTSQTRVLLPKPDTQAFNRIVVLP